MIFFGFCNHGITYIMGVSGPSLLIESTDSMIITMHCLATMGLYRNYFSMAITGRIRMADHIKYRFGLYYSDVMGHEGCKCQAARF